MGDCVTKRTASAHTVTVFLQGYRFGDGHAKAGGSGVKGMGLRSGSGFAASAVQREKVEAEACIVCWQGPCDPAHLIPRSLAPDPHGEPIRVIPLCRTHHHEYDEGTLDLLPFLTTMRWRHELARAVIDHPGGMLGALERITNQSWRPA